MDDKDGAAGGDQDALSLIESVQQLQQLLKQLDQAVNQQQNVLVSAPVQDLKQTMLRESGAISRLLLLERRQVDDLFRRVEARESERERSVALQDVAASINSSLDLGEVLNQVMDVIITLTNAERAMLLLNDEETGRLEVRAARNMDRETIEQSESFQISRSIVQRVADSGIPVATTNAQEDDRFSTQESIISYGLRSILCVPLKIKDEIIGVIYADNRIASGIFGAKDRDLLAAFANQAAVAIENARLFREIRNNLAEMTEMKDLMDNVFASVDGGVITIDNDDQIALYNRAAAKILGVPANAVLSRDYQSALQTMGLPIQEAVEAVKSGGETATRELDIDTGKRSGDTTLVITLTPLRDMEKRTLGVAIVLDDITEQKRLESVRRYLPPRLVDQIRDLDAAQRPQQRVLSVLFADLRGFSGYSEVHQPEWLIEIINGYFSLAVRAINNYQGVTDKFMGDAVMALFNTPLNPQNDHVQRALKAALMIQDEMAAYRLNLPEEHHLHFGIGIHTGQAVVGNVGSDLRKDYSAIGDAVNLAKRLQEVALADQILISEEVNKLAGEQAVVSKLGPMKLKGRQAVEQVFVLQGVNS